MSRNIKAIFSAVSVTLCASIALTLPVEAVATTLPQEEKLYSSFDNVQGSSEIVADILTELKDERTANTKKFLLEDGTKMIAEYEGEDKPMLYDAPRQYALSQKHKPCAGLNECFSAHNPPPAIDEPNAQHNLSYYKLLDT